MIGLRPSSLAGAVPVRRHGPSIHSRYLGRHFWAVGYGAWSTGNITEEAVRQYLEHHRHPSNQESDRFILE